MRPKAPSPSGCSAPRAAKASAQQLAQTLADLRRRFPGHICIYGSLDPVRDCRIQLAPQHPEEVGRCKQHQPLVASAKLSVIQRGGERICESLFGMILGGVFARHGMSAPAFSVKGHAGTVSGDITFVQAGGRIHGALQRFEVCVVRGK